MGMAPSAKFRVTGMPVMIDHQLGHAGVLENRLNFKSQPGHFFDSVPKAVFM
jgi:hypothetical protein